MLPNLGVKMVYSPTEVELGDFSSEKKIEEYVYKNILFLMKNIFNEDVERSERQKRINGSRMVITTKKTAQVVAMHKCRARIDLYVQCKNGNNYAFEFKNPRKTNTTSSIYAISQLLYYSTILPSVNRLVVVSTKYDDGFLEVTNKFSLPVDFLLFAKRQIFLLLK